MQKDNKQKADTNTLTAILIAAGAVISILLAITIIGLANKPQTIFVDVQSNISDLSRMDSISSTLTSSGILSSSSELLSSDIISSNNSISDINSYIPNQVSKNTNTYNNDIQYKSSKISSIPSNSISRIEENTQPNIQSKVNNESISSSITSQITKININTATAKELEKILPIEYLMCKAIVDYRKENGPFNSIEDLMNVDGIGKKLFAKIQPYVTV